MKMRSPLRAARERRLLAAAAVLLLASSCASRPASAELPLASLRLPPGFHIGVFSDKVPGARSLALGDKGTLFVGTWEGQVYAIPGAAGAGTAGRVVTIARGLNMPNGVAFRGGALYVAEVSRILRFDSIEDSLDTPPRPVVVFDRYPRDRHHGWKFIRFGPDGMLYVPIGAPCNICDRGDPYASITRLRVDGPEPPKAFEIYARGIRNTVGFDWNPADGSMWFTDNGRDYLGDDAPPDELNRAAEPGRHFGYPSIHGTAIRDPEFGKGRDPEAFTPPERELGPHVAALGMRFYTGKMFPAEYRGQVLIAEHGSWNRSTPTGYRVSLVRLKGGRAVSYEPFVDGWLSEGRAWGRPVDLQVMPDGSLLVSDDRAGAIYRITH
jgi:glucose/arabinose dehydrogenase